MKLNRVELNRLELNRVELNRVELDLMVWIKWNGFGLNWI